MLYIINWLITVYDACCGFPFFRVWFAIRACYISLLSFLYDHIRQAQIYLESIYLVSGPLEAIHNLDLNP